MKILFICSSRFDYLQDLTYSGLIKLLGKKNVVDYPWNYKFHLPFKSYPKNLGYTGFSFPFSFNNNFKDVGLVILASAKKDALITYNKILPQISNKPILFLDGGDHYDIGGDFYIQQAGDLFKEVT